MTARKKGHDSPSAVAQTLQHRQQLASRWTCEVLKTSHFNAHTPAHTPPCITCGARLSGMSDFKGCFIFGSSVGFVALLCWQTRKQVGNIKHYSGAVTHPNKHTQVHACSCALTHFSGDHFGRQCSSGGEMLTEQMSAGGSPDSSAKVRETRRSGFIST